MFGVGVLSSESYSAVAVPDGSLVSDSVQIVNTFGNFSLSIDNFMSDDLVIRALNPGLDDFSQMPKPVDSTTNTLYDVATLAILNTSSGNGTRYGVSNLGFLDGLVSNTSSINNYRGYNLGNSIRGSVTHLNSRKRASRRPIQKKNLPYMQNGGCSKNTLLDTIYKSLH